MAGELARRREAKLDRETAAQVAQRRRGEAINRAEVEARENLAAYEVSLRMLNGHILTAQAQNHITGLHRTTSAVCKDDPGLELARRDLESIFTFSAGQLVHGYMTRQRRCD